MLKTKSLTNAKTKKLLAISCSPLALENLLRVGKVRDAIVGSTLKQQAETIESEQISRLA